MLNKISSFILVLLVYLFFSGCGEDVSDPPLSFPPDRGVELTKPTIDSSYPKDDEVDVLTDIAINVKFSELMDENSLNQNSFIVKDETGHILSGDITNEEMNFYYKPTNELTTNTTYKVKITTEACDLAGNNLEAEREWYFTTIDVMDLTPPVVLETIPVNDAVDFATNYSISAKFDDDMNPDTISADTFKVLDGNSAEIGGEIVFLNNIATFTPSSFLNPDTLYTARILKDVTNNCLVNMEMDYEWSFTSASGPDNDGPEITAYVPANLALNVEIRPVISATFNEDIKPSSINTDTFLLKDGDNIIEGDVSYDMGSRTATFTMTNDLNEVTEYSVTITTDVTDNAGNNMAGDMTWGFTTGDFSAPEVILTNPVDGAVSISPEPGAIEVMFSEDMDESSITSDTFIVEDDGVVINGAVTYNSGTLTAMFNPVDGLEYNTTYTVKITTEVKDLAGNPLASEYTFSFDTQVGWLVVGNAGFSDGEASDGDTDTISIFVYDNEGTPVPYVAYRDEANSKEATVMKFNGTSWETIGDVGLSDGNARYLSIYIYKGIPYVAYRDYDNSSKATVMRFDGYSWTPVGAAGFSSADPVRYTSLFIYDDGSADGVPYLAFHDKENGASVMKYTGSDWVHVDAGNEIISEGNVDYTSLYVYDDNGTPVPYVAYQDNANSDEATVMRYNGSAWETLGTAGFSAGNVEYVSLSVDNNGTPYVAYRDVVNDNKATVMKYTGSVWEAVGQTGFSTGNVEYVSLSVYDNNGTPVPYVAYMDVANDNKATVMKYTGSVWEPVVSSAFSSGAVKYTSLFVYDDGGAPLPYVVFRDNDENDKATVMLCR